MEGPEVLTVPHELLFRIPGAVQCMEGPGVLPVSNELHGIQEPRVLFNAWRVQGCSQCPMSWYSGSQGALQVLVNAL